MQRIVLCGFILLGNSIISWISLSLFWQRIGEQDVRDGSKSQDIDQSNDSLLTIPQCQWLLHGRGRRTIMEHGMRVHTAM